MCEQTRDLKVANGGETITVIEHEGHAVVTADDERRTFAKVLKISGFTLRVLFLSPSYTSFDPTGVLAWVMTALWKPWHLLLS